MQNVHSQRQLDNIQAELRDEIAYLPTWKDDTADPGLDSPEEMQKNDPPATQIWRPYSKPNIDLPNAERMEDAIWRVPMSFNIGRNLRLDCIALPDQMKFDFPRVEALIVPNTSRKSYFYTYAAEKGKTELFRSKSN